MHAMNASWGGQTFALAKCNDSKVKKSRNRITKEARKTVVESFINNYRTSNNGNFPSLNRTHREVGGSFYIVREIFREIIQENKVLGPATVSSEEQEQKQILSISNDVQSMCEELITDSRGQSISRCYEMVESEDWKTIKSHSNDIYIPQFIHEEATDHQQSLNGDRYINGNPVNEEEVRKPSEPGKIRTLEDEPRHSEVHASKKLDDEIGRQNDSTDRPTGSTMDGRMVSKSVVSEAKDVMNVETSSISVLMQDQPFASTPNGPLSERSEAHAITETLQAQEINLSAEKVELPTGLLTSDTIPSGDLSSHSVDVRTETDITNSFPVGGSTMTHAFSTHKLSNLSKSMDLEGSVSHNDALNLETYDQKHLVTGAELQPYYASNDSQIEEEDVSVANINSTHGESFSVTPRISSGSSEKVTQKPAEGGETNPILAVIKAFVVAFVKFWVE